MAAALGFQNVCEWDWDNLLDVKFWMTIRFTCTQKHSDYLYTILISMHDSWFNLHCYQISYYDRNLSS